MSGSSESTVRAYRHGATDEFSYNIVKEPVHIRDFQATLLHLFGIDHERFTYTNTSDTRSYLEAM